MIELGLEYEISLDALHRFGNDLGKSVDAI